jgi:hypothetical protein
VPDIPGLALAAVRRAGTGLIRDGDTVLGTHRRREVRLEAPSTDITVTTSPRVLARLVGTRVRDSDDVVSASVTASTRRVAVTALAWHDAPPDLREVIVGRVQVLLDELPLRRRPRVAVSVRKQEGVQ